MQRHRKKFALLLAGIVALALFLVFAGKTEPSYGGRRLSEWIAMFHGPHGEMPESGEPGEAGDTIRAIGTNAIPWLLAWSAYDTPAWKAKLWPLANKLPAWLVNNRPLEPLIYNQGALYRAQHARNAFAALGPLAAPAIPELARRIHQTNSPSVRNAAAVALGFIGPQAIPALATALENPDPNGSYWALEGVRVLRTNALPLIPLLVRNLQHSSTFGAMQTAEMLGHRKLAPDIVVPALVKTLRDDSRKEVRWTAALALRDLGELASPAVPALLNALHDPSPDVILDAGLALQVIAPEALTNAPPPAP